MPPKAIEDFVQNIRDMMNDPDRDDSEAFQTIVDAFNQLNEERTNIINNQGDVIAQFAERLAKFKKSSADEQ